MKGKDLQKYLAGVFAIELNIYTLNIAIAKLSKKYYSLAVPRRLSEPKRKSTDPLGSLSVIVMFVGIISGIITGLIGLVYEWLRADNIIEYIACCIAALLYALQGMIVGGAVLGLIVWVIVVICESKSNKKEYQHALQQYHLAEQEDERRISNELAKREVLLKEINALNSRLAQAKKNLSKAYSYNILAPDYRNIYAVSSMHGYLAKGRTHCLQFNENTGDQGAYNIYENERRLDQIITNTEEILVRFDQVIQYQQDLAIGLRDATRKIESLCGNVNTQLNQIRGSVSNIERCQGVIAYNSECAARELEFMNWMTIWR